MHRLNHVVHLLHIIAVLIDNPLGVVRASSFNTQVVVRVLDRLETFMDIPVYVSERMSRFRYSGAFHGDLRASGRDFSMSFLYSETNVTLYYGLEDGTFIMYSSALATSYREPGNSGYDALQPPPEMEKYLNSCVNSKNGEVRNCTMAVGATYVKCVDGCRLERCPDEASQQDCSLLPKGYEREQCQNNIKWCQQYEFHRVSENETVGYIPRTYSCIAPTGQVEQRPGHVMVNADTRELGSCFYEDGVTLVNRSLRGDYAYCGGVICNNTFVGGFRETDYDPRYRAWYVQAKRTQKPSWTEPYTFFTTMDIGITYVHPIHLKSTDTEIFYGVIAIDYTLNQISNFLRSTYGDSDIHVMIAENRYPHYVIATSTATPTTKRVLTSNTSVACPDNASSTECTAVRVPIAEYEGTPKDNVLQRSFLVHAQQGFPDHLIGVKDSEKTQSGAFASQSRPYTQPGANLEWQIIVTMPMSRAAGDAVKTDDALFFAAYIMVIFGVVVCSILLAAFYRNRNHPAVMQADWRFTCLFLIGCIFLNITSLTFLGDNTDQLCMLRMWSFNAVFVCTLSPLFVKVWRMYRLITASIGFKRLQVSHLQAFLMTLPLVFLELILLTVFSVIDPPRSTEFLDVSGCATLQYITCEQNGRAFFISQSSFHAFLIVVGCYLAYRTRDLDPRFGEAKQLGFAMYNIAFTGIVIVALLLVIDMTQRGILMLQTIGVLWGTIVSSFAFVLPRVIEVAANSGQHRWLLTRFTEAIASRTSDKREQFSSTPNEISRTEGNCCSVTPLDQHKSAVSDVTNSFDQGLQAGFGRDVVFPEISERFAFVES